MKKAIIFDFDGTLTELTLNFDTLKDEIETIALKYVDRAVVEGLRGHYLVEMIFEIEKVLGEKGAFFKDEALGRLREMEIAASGGKGVYPFTRKVLSDLRTRGIRCAIITRNCIDALKTVFPDMEEYVEGVVTREHTRYLKPNPGQVLEAMALLHVSPDEAMVVGDHPTDVMAGRALGMDTAGVLTGRTNRQAFEEAGASYILADIRDLLVLDIIT